MTSFWWIIRVLAMVTAVTEVQHLVILVYAVISIQSTVASATTTTSAITSCGGILTARNGIIQTPNFPNKFPIPITCTWIIDASAYYTMNASIFIYFTQQYVMSGLKITEYMYYSDDYPVKSLHPPYELKDEAVTRVAWIHFTSPFLKVEFHLDSLHGTHLRVLDRFLDVYGFNITYEMSYTVKSYQCNALQCRFLGNCLASYDWSSYYCSCYTGLGGKDCGLGPLCHDGENNICANGGTCKPIGDASVTCICPAGYTGSKCETAENGNFVNAECTSEKSCAVQCSFSGNENDVCKCNPNITITKSIERTRFEATVRLISADTDFYSERKTKGNLQLLEKHISRFMRNANITNITDLTVLSTSKNDEFEIRDTIYRMIDKGRLGNYTVDQTRKFFHIEAALNLKAVNVNHKSVIREDSEFILTCEAEGSSRILFKWYMNGNYINTTRATRKMWTSIEKIGQNLYLFSLRIPKANKMDEGIYTCQALDYGYQECHSTTVEIQVKPELRIDPQSVTLYRGDSLTIRCLSPGNDRRYGILGYSWTKNNALFQSDPDVELWEELYPDGSILRINRIQKSANYTCVSSNSIGHVAKSVYIHVVESDDVELCKNEDAFGVKWPATWPGSPIVADCPKYYKGHAERICEQRDFRKPTWLIPDFSKCVADELLIINNNFRSLTFGYQKTNGSSVMKSCLDYAINYNSNFLPGEAGYLLKLLLGVFSYIEQKDSFIIREFAKDTILEILDLVLKNEHAINNQEQVKQLQMVMQSAIMIPEVLSSTSPVPVPSTSLQYHQRNTFRIYKDVIKGFPFKRHINGDQIFPDKLYMQIEESAYFRNIEITNETVSLSVVAYQNLTRFLPKMYTKRGSNQPDMNYMTASRVIAAWLYSLNRTNDIFDKVPLHLPLEIARMEIIFQHENIPDNDWVRLCGYDSQATFAATWRTDRCTINNSVANSTTCICPISGTFVVLLAKRNYSVSSKLLGQTHSMYVIIGCGSCFLQSCATFAILLPILYKRKCTVIFLKMQFCTATSSAMAIFTLGLLKLLPQDYHGVISSTLAGLLLLGTSTLVSITLIVQYELGPRKNPSTYSTSAYPSNIATGMFGVIGLSWFLPILYAISLPLIYTIIGRWPLNWWLEFSSIGLMLFLIIELLFVILFGIMVVTLLHKLLYLAGKYDKRNSAILKRIGLIYRTILILVIKIFTDGFHLIYLHLNENIFGYIFGTCCILLGFSILTCFIIKAEIYNKSNSQLSDKKGLPTTPSATKHSIEEYCSGSINSPLSFFTNHDIDKDNDSAPNIILQTPSELVQYPLTINNPLSFQTGTIGNACETAFLQYDQNSSCSTGSGVLLEHGCLLQRHRNTFNAYQMDKSDIRDPCFSNVEHIGTNEFVGVSSLDILQGVQQDSIVGIHSNEITKPIFNSTIKYPAIAIPIQAPAGIYITSTFESPANIQCSLGQSTSILLPANGFCTEQLECNKQLSQQISQSQPITSSTSNNLSILPTPIITITPTDDEHATVQTTDDKRLSGMMDRISHDLDYLLNRTTDNNISTNMGMITPSISSAPHIHSISSTCLECIGNHCVHEIIIEESEE